MPKCKHLFTVKGRMAVKEIKAKHLPVNPYAIVTAKVKGSRLKPSRIRGGKTTP